MSENIDNDKSWFAKGTAYERVTKHISNGKKIVRIATGWFSVAGWNLIRKFIGNKQVLLIVGINEPYRRDVTNAKIVIIDEIIQELGIGIKDNIREAVEKLVERIESNQFKVVDGRAMKHHAKLYIVDDCVAVAASANLSKNGLKTNIEAGSEIHESQEIKNRIKEFDKYFATARNLTQELLEALKDWLRYSNPWDAYLKTLIALEDLNLDKKYIQPTSYQVDMIAKTLGQIREHNGSMLVASTGLGKTAVAIHVALQLVRSNEITNVLLLCPKIVRKNWERQLLRAGISHKPITYQGLDKEEPELDCNLQEFLEIEDLINLHWLIIIDESHFFRNSKEDDVGFRRRSFQKLLPLIEQKDCKILLLTGSPYSKSIDNLNDQLLLLPHTQPKNKRWVVNDINDFIDLPVASQLTTPHVAKEYGEEENANLFIWFGSDKRYIPSVILYKLDVPVFMEAKAAQILNNNLLTVLEPSNSPNIIKQEIQKCCASSPAALCHALEKVVNTPGKNSFKVEFETSKAERDKSLSPLINELKNLEYKQDTKLLVLQKLLDKIFAQGELAIIFCERYATVFYLVEALEKLFPSYKIFGTVRRKEHTYSLKSLSKIQKAISDFAPIANKVKKKSKNTYDVFIATDAHGVGINLQDASVVINYDLSWTTIEPIQRAGRILRPWIEPRIVRLYSFVPISDNNSFSNIISRWDKLMDRHDESKKILNLPVLSVEDKEEIYDLSQISSKIKIKSGKLDLDLLATEPVSDSYVKQHASILHKNRNDARQLKDEIISSKIYSGKKILVYVLLKHKDKYHWAVYYPDNKTNSPKLEAVSKEQLLDRLKCDRHTEKALVPLKKIERLADECIKAWCRENKVDPEHIYRECTVYLKPRTAKNKISNLALN